MITRCWDEDWMTSVWGSTDTLAATIAQADVLLMRYGSPKANPQQTGEARDERLRGRRCTIFDESQFALEDELHFLDGTSLRVYFKK